jgi:hypothetical protein
VTLKKRVFPSGTSWHFGGPLVLTISVPKGGDNKTWTAFNLASIIGLWGYDVAVIDSNAQHDLWSDVQFLATRGLTPRFDVVLHDPLDADGNQTPLPDLSAQKERQILIWDTSQYVQLKTSKWAWQNCHAMILTVSPQISQVRNYLQAIQLYQHMPGKRGPLLVLPCRAKTLNNSAVQRDFQQVLRFLEEQGCVVPKIRGEYIAPDQLIPESELMSLQHTRWIYDEREFGGATKRLTDVFIRKTLLSMTWIRAELEAAFGLFPVPKLKPVLPDPTNREGIMSVLRAEFAQRKEAMAGGAASAV